MIDLKKIFSRITTIYILIILVVVLIIGWVAYLQFFTGEKDKEKDIRIAYCEQKIEPHRGDVLSHKGKVLATSIPYYKLYMDCTVADKDTFRKHIDALSRKLSGFFKDKPARWYKKYITTARKEGKRYKPIGNRVVDYSELMEIKKFPILKLSTYKGGLIIESTSKRDNPYGSLAYRTIGFINTLGTGVGIEGSCDYYLRGKPGSRIVQKILGGTIPINNGEKVKPEDGYDIRTTIDIGIQEAAEKALKEQLVLSDQIEGATAIVMDVKTGAVRAIANMKKTRSGNYDESYNYAIGQAGEPGSVFKLATLTCLLEDGYVTLDTPIDGGKGVFEYGRHKFTDHGGGYGMMDVKTALAKSSNVAYAKLAVTYYASDPQKYCDRIQSMKIGEKMHLDIKGEATSTIYNPGDPMWSMSTLPSMAIGYSVLLTPMQILTFYNAIANGGIMMRPYFIESYEKNGKVVKEFPPQEVSGSICSRKTAETDIKALRGVVEHGTGRALDDERYHIAGKTGTARVAFGGKIGYELNGRRKYQATFCGLYPSEHPRFSSIVVFYSAPLLGNFYGAQWAAPVFKKIADFIYSTHPEWEKPLDGKGKSPEDLPSVSGGIAGKNREAMSGVPAGKLTGLIKGIPDNSWVKFVNDSSNIKIKKYDIKADSLTDVTGMGIKDAIFLLENQGCKVRFSGYGRVTAQNPAPGTEVRKNMMVNLTLSNDED
ncbi:MAG: transpeptidase family protein [Bacteroidales bacterium]|jgi:cell division protein FtsI (penicillin-binding protein 3)|nr:transpeptidase family protein [Bacteroidales bacterium]